LPRSRLPCLLQHSARVPARTPAPVPARASLLQGGSALPLRSSMCRPGLLLCRPRRRGGWSPHPRGRLCRQVRLPRGSRNHTEDRAFLDQTREEDAGSPGVLSASAGTSAGSTRERALTAHPLTRVPRGLRHARENARGLPICARPGKPMANQPRLSYPWPSYRASKFDDSRGIQTLMKLEIFTDYV